MSPAQPTENPQPLRAWFPGGHSHVNPTGGGGQSRTELGGWGQEIVASQKNLPKGQECRWCLKEQKKNG